MAALARRHYRLDRGVLAPIDVARVLSLTAPDAALPAPDAAITAATGAPAPEAAL